jgi:hypothetical protein
MRASGCFGDSASASISRVHVLSAASSSSFYLKSASSKCIPTCRLRRFNGKVHILSRRTQADQTDATAPRARALTDLLTELQAHAKDLEISNAMTRNGAPHPFYSATALLVSYSCVPALNRQRLQTPGPSIGTVRAKLCCCVSPLARHTHGG